MKKKLAIISSHPIQYNAPAFAMLAKSEILDIRVFYTWSQSRESIFDKDFGKTIQWDIPLLEGYDYEFAENVSRHPGPGSFNGIICPSLIKSISDWGAEALLIFGWKYQAHFRAMRHFKGRIPIWFRGDSTLLDETGGIKQTIRRLILRFVYSYCDGAFYVGENNRQYFLKHGFRDSQLFFAPHAIDNLRFSDPVGTMRVEAEKWRTQLGIGPEEIVVLFVGKFEPKKDPLTLIRAADTIKRPGVHYVFVGNGPLDSQMKEHTMGKKHFHFIPFQNQSRIPSVYHMCDILALPSAGPEETWGLVVNEAMACGKAVLVSNKAGCAADLVKAGENGFVFTAGNKDDCAAFLGKMTESKSVSIEMGKASLKIIEPWSFETICRNFEKHISDHIK